MRRQVLAGEAVILLVKNSKKKHPDNVGVLSYHISPFTGKCISPGAADVEIEI
jgi:hypothetical protein